MAVSQKEGYKFVRHQNEQAIPESMCILCFHSMVAPDVEALEQREHEHHCPGRWVNVPPLQRRRSMV